MSKAEIVAAIPGTSQRSIQRAFVQRRDHHNAELTTFGRHHRVRLEARLPLPLLAPDSEDLVAFTYVVCVARPIVSPETHARLELALEELDARARQRVAPSDLPRANAITSTYSQASNVDPLLIRDLLLACHRKTVRITYQSPWDDTPPVSHHIEPWAIHVHDVNHYLRCCSRSRDEPRTFNCAFIESLELDDPPPEYPVPARPWADEGRAFGVDSDRPGVAVLRFEVSLARWLASVKWHPEQRDEWIEPRELLERTVPYHSCRECRRRTTRTA
jgi:predicted DNA-binding transcriptional regulator YafY